jgi:hypothetical protein
MNTDWTFKTVIAYDTLSSAIHAKEMSERVAVHMESEFDAWPFELLAVSCVREQAIRTAAAADMVILAAHGAVELPDPVKNWIESALRQKHNGSAALVALLHDDWITSAKPPPLCAYLQQIAERSGVEFFCNLGPWRGEYAIEGGYQFLEPDSTVRDEGSPEYSAARGEYE